MSADPPGAKGMTSFTGLLGKSLWARATGATPRPAHSTPAELAALQQLVTETLAPVVKRLNIQLD